MAITTISSDNELSLKQWSKVLAAETSKALRISSLIGRSNTSIIQEKIETAKGGSAITFGLRAQMMGTGVSEGQTLKGNEEAIQFMNDQVVINELRHAVKTMGEDSIDDQRFVGSLRSEAKDALVDWFADRISLMFFLQVCGYTANKIVFEDRELVVTPKHYGFNTPTAPTEKRIIRPDSKTKDEDLTDAGKHKFTLELIDQAVETAKLSNPKIRPVRVGGDNYYVLYLHPKQVTQLRTNTNKGQWLDIQQSMYSASRKSNPIFDGSLGIYNGVVLREHEHVTPGVHSTNGTMEAGVRRAILLGAQSAVIAYGKRFSNLRYKLREEFVDYGHEYGLSASTIIGMKKTRFKLPGGGEGIEDYGTIVISTYAK